MNLKKQFDAIPLFWKINIGIILLMIIIEGFTELVFEGLTADILVDLYGGFLPWHIFVVRTISILLPSIIAGYVISVYLSNRLDRMALASEAIAHGDLNTRLPTTNNQKNAFDNLSRSFNAMADAIERQLQNERRLKIDISHELRSPLTRLLIAAETLRLRKQDERDSTAIARIEKEGRHMRDLIGLLLSWSQDHSEGIFDPEPVQLMVLLPELADDFSFLGRQENKKIMLHAEGELIIKGNAMLLRRMLSNIMSNAIFFTPQNTEIHINAQQTEREIVISIRDFGPGVPEENLKDIFQTFYRVDMSRTRLSGGVGLGLALAREAAHAHGGEIEARNVDPGLEITIRLPNLKN